MTDYDGPPTADAPEAFLRLLPLRAQVIGRRLTRFADSGWDINGLALIHADTTRLASESLAYGLEDTAEPLQGIADLLTDVLAREELPEPELGQRLCRLAQAFKDYLPSPIPEAAPDAYVAENLFDETPFGEFSLPAEPATAEAQALADAESARIDADMDVWGDGATLFGRAADVPPATVAAAPPAVVQQKVAIPSAAGPAVASATSVPGTPVPAARATPAGDAGLLLPKDFRVYHLTGYGELSLELDQRIEAQGVEIELLEDVDELNELLSALPADLVVIDACFSSQLESIGTTVRLARTRNSKQRLLLVAIAEADDIGLRLSARRAGVDSLIVDPIDASDVLKRLQMLVDPEREDPFRVLIVEDDRSQALFAEGILRNAGMDSLVVIDALDVMPALNQFRPDLILMDMNMPGANGIELTALIREQDAFTHTPIVFLSGESSEDLQFDAIDAGGDDFLSKPIRPRHLISAVQTRVRRHRQQESRRVKRPEKDAATGLVYRKSLLDQLEECLGSGQPSGGLIFVEIESLGLLRERIGLTALEILLGDVSRLLTNSAADMPATRFGDGSYLLLDRRGDDAGMDALAANLRQTLMQAPFQALGHPLRLRLSVGVCAFRHRFSDSATIINAVEKMAREARTDERGVRRFEPQRPTEALQEAALMTQLRQSIDQDNLVLLYQPVVAVAGNDISQYQVLLRMRDAGGKLRSAAEIIPMAERTSLIIELDRWVLSQAIALIQSRSEEGSQLRLYVTQSPLTLGSSGQSDWLKREIADCGIDGASLVIELRLEDVAVHSATVRQFCDAMVANRVQFCLSQFESGSETESLISQLPLSFVKLARKYTTGTLPPNLRDELKTLISQAHRRNLQVIGHGVEDAQAAATLWMSGIDFIQGNLVQQADQDMSFDFHQAVL